MTTFEITKPAGQGPLFAVGEQTGSLYLVPVDPMRDPGRFDAILIVGRGGLEGKEGMRQYLELRDRLLPPGTTITITT